jgi:hypothetical protein
MLAFATSVLHEYPLFWLNDPALKQPEIPPECEPIADEAPEAFAARKAKRDEKVEEARDEHERTWARCIETGRWDELRLPGKQPTSFVCRPIPGATWRAFLDHVRNPDNEIGDFQRASLAFRLAVIRVENFAPGFKVERVEHKNKRGEPSGLGLVLDEKVTDVLDNITMDIVMALGTAVIKQRGGPAGK